jgi:ankyrin repeat protein
MDDTYLLEKWLEEHPDDIENRFRLKTPLLLAVKHNSYNCFQILMKYNANMEEYNPQNESALLIAVRLNRRAMIKDLITQGASLLPEDRMARTAIEILISRDDIELIRFIHEDRQNLLEHDLLNQEFPLSLAISHQSRNCINYILSLQPKAQTFLIRRKHNCPIEAAIRRNDVETMKTLVTLEDFMYIVNQKIHKSISYIHLAVQKRRSQIVEILLRNEALIDAVDNEGNTPAHYASDLPTLRIPIHYGADLTLKNKYKETPQMTAKRENKNCVYQFLRLYTI